VRTNSTSPFSRPALTPDDVARQLRHLPSAPRVLPRLKQLLSDGNSAMHEVVALIRLDPGIAARVLHIGNSAYFSHGLRCYTVDEAVNRVGYDQVYELVASAVASEVLVRPLHTYGLEADELWRRSIACALAAESLATRLSVDRDIAYTVGLLHSLGMVAIDAWAFQHQPDLRLVSRGLPYEAGEAERAALGFHQAEAGAALLRSWDFPAVMSEPIRWQYLPRGTVAHFTGSALLHVAKWLRSAALRADHPPHAGAIHGGRPPLPDASILQALNLTPSRLEFLAEEVRARLSSVHSLLETTAAAVVSFPGGTRQVADSGIARVG